MSLLRRRGEQYASHPIAAAPGTHARMVELALKHAPVDGRLLDLGAHTGALIARLRDAGFDRLSGADLSCRLTEPVELFQACDFNRDFAGQFDAPPFDCITACEVIEHLDDPRGFLRQCRALLAMGGTLVLSTPNVQFFEGRIKFALTGELWGFSEKSYRSQRHISPIMASHVPMMLAECGFECREIATGASFATPLRRLLTFPIWAVMRLLLGPMVSGESLFIVARAVARDTNNSLPGQHAWRHGVAVDPEGGR